jgi:ribose 5-phosphate isomerase B
VMGIGARMHSEHEALEMARAFLSTPFSGDPRHARRIELLADYERDGKLPV